MDRGNIQLVPPSESLESRVVLLGHGDQPVKYCDNIVRTYHYTKLTFLPLFFLEEFNPNTKIANCYFLVISAMQTIQPISNTDGLPTVLIPLFFVLVR